MVPLTRVVEEKSIVRLGVFDKPIHGLLHILLGRNLARVLLVVRQDDHVLPLVVIAFVEEPRDVGDIVDAAAQLTLLAKVVDADEKSLATTGAVGVLEGVSLGRTAAKRLHTLRRRGPHSLLVAHRVAVGVVALRRRPVRRRILVLLHRRTAVVGRGRGTAVIALRWSVTLSWRGAPTALLRRRATIPLRRRAAVSLRRRTAIALGRRRTSITSLGRAVIPISRSRTATVTPARSTTVVLLGSVATLAWIS